jgi:short-subunit dehydrogenase
MGGDPTMSNPKTILITGASAGIGRDAAIHFAKQGHQVIASGRNVEALQRLAAEAKLEIIVLDVNDPASIEAARAEVLVLTRGRGIDVLINSAGYGCVGALAELSDRALRDQFETNVFGLMGVTRAFLPEMMARRSGRIVNVGSTGGRVTFPLFGAYHASKYALEALSDALRIELAAFGIKVSLLEPGPIQSEFQRRSLEQVEERKRERAGSAYASAYARADQIAARTEAMAVGPEHTTRAMEHAISARWPRARYVVPFKVALMFALLRCLPTFGTDLLFQHFMNLTARRLLQPRLQSGEGTA